MRWTIILIISFLSAGSDGRKNIVIDDEGMLDFKIEYNDVFNEKVQMFCSLMDAQQNPVAIQGNSSLDLPNEVLPLDIFCYYEDTGNEGYYTLVTKTVYGIDENISYFTKERLSQESYLQEVMPHNKLTKNDHHYELKVGFGAPDITYTLDLFHYDEFNNAYPHLVRYFQTYDQIDIDPKLVQLQHNFDYSKVMGQETSKMSISVTRYFEYQENKTLVINYTLSLIHNLPPEIFGGGGILVNQMKKGVVALVRDTRSVCEKK